MNEDLIGGGETISDDYVEPHEADFWVNGFDERALGYYVLDGDNNVRGPVPMAHHAAWMTRHKPTGPGDPPPWRCRVGHDRVGAATISTVFLSRDLGFGETREPKTFETIVTSDGGGECIWRHTTWDEAAAFHRRLVEDRRRQAGALT